ncbi:MAG: DUF58 domain-containing protein [Chloroflexi bacterium]|nr:DUF58 domain-containing protein [Chloroflexota bacterium]MYD48323.1 DUF58 domain-containing protein [Chloroflexota bacterium]
MGYPALMTSDLWAIAAAILISAGLLASLPLLIVVGVLVLLVWTTGKYWPRFAFRRLTYSRRLERRRAFIGDLVDYHITVDNDKLLPMIWLDISDAFPLGLHTGGTYRRGVGAEAELDHRITTSLLPYQRVTWRYRIRCRARGYHRIGPARLRSGDMFGITAAEEHVTAVDYLLVYPRIVDLRRMMNLWERPLGVSRGRRLIQDDPSRFVGLRDYLPSDPLKRIDWKATARHSRLESRIFEPAATRYMLIALNARTGDAAWQGSNRRLFERAVTVAASIAEYAQREDYTFGLVSNAVASYSSKWMSVPPGSGSLQLEATLESLAMAGPFWVAELSAVLRAETETLASGATVVLVTALLSRGVIQEAGEIRRRGHRVIVFYAGDGEPRAMAAELPPDIPLFLAGAALSELDELWREDWQDEPEDAPGMSEPGAEPGAEPAL